MRHISGLRSCVRIVVKIDWYVFPRFHQYFMLDWSILVFDTRSAFNYLSSTYNYKTSIFVVWTIHVKVSERRFVHEFRFMSMTGWNHFNYHHCLKGWFIAVCESSSFCPTNFAQFGRILFNFHTIFLTFFEYLW